MVCLTQSEASLRVCQRELNMANRGWMRVSQSASRFIQMLVLMLFTASAWAEVAVPAYSSRAVDLTATLSAEQLATLESKLAAFEASKGSQIAVLIVPTTEPEDIAQFGIRVADAWKSGRAKTDDGLILIVAKNDRKLRVEVGYGLEGAVPDAIAKRVISETITPKFKAGDFYGGIDAGVTQLMQLIEGESLPPPQAAQSQQRGGFDAFLPLLIGGMVVGFVLSKFLGRPLGGAVAAAGTGAVGWLLMGAGIVSLIVGAFVFFGVLSRGGGGFLGGGGGFGGGGFGRGGGFGGGGGGGFGGGGASGSW